VKPATVVASTPCPTCGAPEGQRCDYCSAPAHKIHKERREAYRTSTLGIEYLKNRATVMEAQYGIKAVA